MQTGGSQSARWRGTAGWDGRTRNYELKDLNFLPDMPLTPSNEVVSNTVKLDNNVEYDNHSVHVGTNKSMDTAKVETVEYS